MNVYIKWIFIEKRLSKDFKGKEYYGIQYKPEEQTEEMEGKEKNTSFQIEITFLLYLNLSVKSFTSFICFFFL